MINQLLVVISPKHITILQDEGMYRSRHKTDCLTLYETNLLQSTFYIGVACNVNIFLLYFVTCFRSSVASF